LAPPLLDLRLAGPRSPHGPGARDERRGGGTLRTFRALPSGTVGSHLLRTRAGGRSKVGQAGGRNSDQLLFHCLSDTRTLRVRAWRLVDRRTGPWVPDPRGRPRLQGAIALLTQDPRPPAARALRGRPAYRLQVGDYRTVYSLLDDLLLVVVVAFGHRRDAYEH